MVYKSNIIIKNHQAAKSRPALASVSSLAQVFLTPFANPISGPGVQLDSDYLDSLSPIISPSLTSTIRRSLFHARFPMRTSQTSFPSLLKDEKRHCYLLYLSLLVAPGLTCSGLSDRNLSILLDAFLVHGQIFYL